MINIFEPSNQLAELQAEWFNYRNNLYPDFVVSERCDSVPEDIPVFSFHNTTSEDIHQKLDYLHKNNYSTITADEYIRLKGKCNGERLAMLTFDDGLRSLWSVVFPRLASYKMKAVAFVVPGEIEAQNKHREELGLSPEEGPLCSWNQLNSIKDSVDIQSHSFLHWLIFVKPEISAFFSPEVERKWQRIDWPIPSFNRLDDPGRKYKYGTPIYKTDARLSDSERIYESAAINEACIKYVNDNGGELFFNTKGWRNKLMVVHKEAMGDLCLEKESPEDRLISMKRCFTESKNLLEDRLGNNVRHFCFPFGIGSRKAEEIAKESGYHAVYYGVKANFDFKDKGGDGKVSRVTRIKDDYLYRLPGIGRKSLLRIFLDKAKRRFDAMAGKGMIR